MTNFEISQAFAMMMDQQDPLGHFRKSFRIPSSGQKDRVYFLGNSLGLQPVTVKDQINHVLDQWEAQGVESFFHGESPWMDIHQSLQKPLAIIAGAKPDEVVVMNQLSVNIHLMLVSFYRPLGKRNKILMERNAFPSDLYAVTSHLEHLGLAAEEVILFVDADHPNQPISDEACLQMIETHAEELALVFLGGVNYLTGQLLDMQRITACAHKFGAWVGFDLAHAMGNVSMSLHDWQVDFACWCSYKYLNGGPGAVGGVFIHEKHHQHDVVRLAGWWGNRSDSRFKMERNFVPEMNAAGWQLSTPPILYYAILKASMDLFESAGWEKILSKSNLLKDWSWLLIKDLEQKGLLKCITPTSRGAQLSLVFFSHGREIYQALFEKGFMVDWREPNVIRFAPVPLYNTFSEVWDFYLALKEIVSAGLSKPNHEQN